MKPEVYIAGIGVITAIGNNVAECLSALENEQAGMGDITYLETVHRNKIPVAEVKLSNKELAETAGVSVETSRTTLLSLLAAREALQDAGITDHNKKMKTGKVLPIKKTMIMNNSWEVHRWNLNKGVGITTNNTMNIGVNSKRCKALPQRSRMSPSMISRIRERRDYSFLFEA